eukprot:GHVL01032315.1.p2 GENE.GHVL01032315.1~~GHVL01032315.1.p2  ORF type:complete len:111 (-),score=9.67 GHVL01032315.1:47-379(-)
MVPADDGNDEHEGDDGAEHAASSRTLGVHPVLRRLHVVTLGVVDLGLLSQQNGEDAEEWVEEDGTEGDGPVVHGAPVGVGGLGHNGQDVRHPRHCVRRVQTPATPVQHRP